MACLPVPTLQGAGDPVQRSAPPQCSAVKLTTSGRLISLWPTHAASSSDTLSAQSVAGVVCGGGGGDVSACAVLTVLQTHVYTCTQAREHTHTHIQISRAHTGLHTTPYTTIMQTHLTGRWNPPGFLALPSEDALGALRLAGLRGRCRLAGRSSSSPDSSPPSLQARVESVMGVYSPAALLSLVCCQAGCAARGPTPPHPNPTRRHTHNEVAGPLGLHTGPRPLPTQQATRAHPWPRCPPTSTTHTCPPVRCTHLPSPPLSIHYATRTCPRPHCPPPPPPPGPGLHVAKLWRRRVSAGVWVGIRGGWGSWWVGRAEGTTEGGAKGSGMGNGLCE